MRSSRARVRSSGVSAGATGGLRGAADKLERALAANGVEHDIKEYSDAGHSFLNNHAGIWFALLGKIMGLGYDEAAATDARRRILAFFDRELR